MFKKLSNAIVDRQIRKSLLAEEDRITYQYAYEVLLDKTANITAAVIAALLFDSYLVVAVFLISYIPLRSYAGGYHARTNAGCAVLSFLTLCAVSVGMKYLPIAEVVPSFILLECVPGMILLVLAPVEDRNKPLEENERRIYRKKTGWIFGIEAAVGISLCVIGLTYIWVTILISHTVLAIMLIRGKISDYVVNREAGI